MRIVITDGATLNPGDLDWSPFEAIGQVTCFDSTPAELVKERCKGASVIITNKTNITRDVILSASSLKLVAVSATGYNNVDINAARENGVTVCNVPEYGTGSVAQHTFALLLELTNHVCENLMSTKKDEWPSELWSYTRKPIMELKGKTMGIVGFGRIGQQVANMALAFGMAVIFSNRSIKTAGAFRQVPTDELFRVSDVVSLNCPLTDDNKEFVNLALLGTMKREALLLNTSRGQLINEDDLATALDRNILGGAALDVLSQEPPAAQHKLIHHPKCIVTPHNAWISFEARSRLMATTLSNVKNFVEGRKQNVVV